MKLSALPNGRSVTKTLCANACFTWKNALQLEDSGSEASLSVSLLLPPFLFSPFFPALSFCVCVCLCVVRTCVHVCVCAHCCMHAFHSACVEVRGQFVVLSLLLYESQGLNSGCQT